MIGSNLSIFRKGLLLVGVPILFQLLLLGFLLRLQNETSDVDYWALHTKEVIVQVEEAYRYLTDAISQTRGAVATGQVRFAPELDASRDMVEPAIQRLENLVSDNPPQQARIRQWHVDATEVLHWIDSQRALVEAGKGAEAVSRLNQIDEVGVIARMRTQYEAIIAEERRLDQARLARVAKANRQTDWFVGAAGFVTVVLAGSALLVFTRGVAGRLAALASNAARLADRLPLAPEVVRTDEIGQVDSAFRQAAGRLAAAEQSEHRYRAELEKRALELASTNSELNRANEELRFKTQEIETFVYSVSHDLRSPLVNLQGFGKELQIACAEVRRLAADPDVPDNLQRPMTSLIDTDITESLRYIQSAVVRAGNIIEALLRLSRAGRVEYRTQRVNVGAIVRRVVDAMSATVAERGAIVRVNDLPDAEADSTAVEQIFGNLLNNAINYLAPERSGQIEIGVAPNTDDDGMVRYFVRDNGLGIPSAYLSKMFVAFQRLHGHVAPGEGIGLALTRRVVERLGGTISVESVEGVGSTFLVTLPAVAQDAPGSAVSAVSTTAIVKEQSLGRT